MRIICLFLALSLIVACSKASSPPDGKLEKSSPPKIVVEKEKTEKELPLPPEVKIRLKRDGKDNYSWELSGSDADQILKVNEKLKKQLGGEQHR